MNLEMEPLEPASESVGDQIESVSTSSILVDILKKPKLLVRSERIHLKGLSFGSLTKEQEIYIQEIKNAVFSSSDQSRNLAFGSLQYDPTISVFLSQLSSFISSETGNCAVNPHLRKLRLVMRMLHHILQNENIPDADMKRHLHEMLPAVLTSIVCSTLSRSSESEADDENEKNLRVFGAALLERICARYSNSVNRIRERVVTVLGKALENPQLDFGSVYGCLISLRTLDVEGGGWTVGVDVEDAVKQRVEGFLSSADSFRSRRLRWNALRIRDLLNKSGTTPNKNIVSDPVPHKKFQKSNEEFKNPQSKPSDGPGSGKRTEIPKPITFEPTKVASATSTSRFPVPVTANVLSETVTTNFQLHSLPLPSAEIAAAGDPSGSKKMLLSSSLLRQEGHKNSDTIISSDTPPKNVLDEPVSHKGFKGESSQANSSADIRPPIVTTKSKTCFILKKDILNGVEQFYLQPMRIFGSDSGQPMPIAAPSGSSDTDTRDN